MSDKESKQPISFGEIVKKIEALKNGGSVDLSLEEDLSIAVMNLISLEEHFYFSGVKTDKAEYFDLLNEVRAVRRELLERMINKHEGETWCISKHLLAATMRLIEVGTKYLSDGKKEDAKKIFNQGAAVYSMFWALRLKLISARDVKKISDDQLNIHDSAGTPRPWKHEDILKKLVDCCDEK